MDYSNECGLNGNGKNGCERRTYLWIIILLSFFAVVFLTLGLVFTFCGLGGTCDDPETKTTKKIKGQSQLKIQNTSLSKQQQEQNIFKAKNNKKLKRLNDKPNYTDKKDEPLKNEVTEQTKTENVLKDLIDQAKDKNAVNEQQVVVNDLAHEQDDGNDENTQHEVLIPSKADTKQDENEKPNFTVLKMQQVADIVIDKTVENVNKSSKKSKKNKKEDKDKSQSKKHKKSKK